MKRKAFVLLALVVVYGAVELLALLAYTLVAEDAFSFSGLQHSRTAVIQAPDRTLSLDQQGAPQQGGYQGGGQQIPLQELAVLFQLGLDEISLVHNFS